MRLIFEDNKKAVLDRDAQRVLGTLTDEQIHAVILWLTMKAENQRRLTAGSIQSGTSKDPLADYANIKHLKGIEDGLQIGASRFEEDVRAIRKHLKQLED
jgi:hypothetical protein